MKKQSLGWMVLAAGMAVMVTGAQAQRGQVDRPSMTATGSPLEGAERGSRVSGPTLGYVWDASTANVHMVTGIAGSSLAGSPVHPGGQVRLAAISPTREYAVVADERGAVVFYGEPSPRGAARVALWRDASAVSHAAVSPSGDRFALFSADSGRLALYEVNGGLPGEATVFSAGSPLGEVVRMAVPDEGGAVFAITRGGAGTDLVRLGTDGGVRSLAALPGAADLALFSRSTRALVLDAAQSALYEIDLGSGSPALSLLASQAEGIEQASAIALSGDDRSVAVISTELRRAVVIDLGSRASRQVDLPETPTGVRRLNARGVFQVTDASAGPILLLEVQQDSARTVYVPRSVSTRGADSSRAGLH